MGEPTLRPQALPLSDFEGGQGDLPPRYDIRVSVPRAHTGPMLYVRTLRALEAAGVPQEGLDAFTAAFKAGPTRDAMRTMARSWVHVVLVCRYCGLASCTDLRTCPTAGRGTPPPDSTKPSSP